MIVAEHREDLDAKIEELNAKLHPHRRPAPRQARDEQASPHSGPAAVAVGPVRAARRRRGSTSSSRCSATSRPRRGAIAHLARMHRK
jgi:hypothetical protein